MATPPIISAIRGVVFLKVDWCSGETRMSIDSSSAALDRAAPQPGKAWRAHH